MLKKSDIVQSILTNNPCYKAGKTIKVKGLMIHSVGTPQPNASVFIKNWNKTSYDRACVHAFIDANTGTVYQTLPWNHRGWHGGGTSNDTHIGVEMCEPDVIKYTGGASFTATDKTKAREMVKRTYESAVELFALLCNEYNLDPLADGVIVSHREGNRLGISSNHADPEHLWTGLDMGYTMDTFRKAIKESMTKTESKPETEIDVMYRVQIGAYSKASNASNQLYKVKLAGFNAYITRVNDLYKIQVGAYSVKSNAEKMLARIKAAGFDGYIVSVKSTSNKTSTSNTSATNKTTSYFKKYTGNTTSISEALRSINEQYTYAYREKIATANGIKDYEGTAKQNTTMLNLLKQGKLIKP